MKNVLIVLVLFLTACNPTKESVDLLVVNSNTYTVDGNFSNTEAFAVNNGKFVAVGASEEIQKKYTSNQVIDAKGKTITPGLIDAHCHFYGLGQDQQLVDLVGTKSYDEILEKVKNFQEQNPKEFILGTGWDQNDWELKEFPNKHKLDELFPDIPVALRRVDGHALLVNQKALDMAGIDENTKATGG